MKNTLAPPPTEAQLDDNKSMKHLAVYGAIWVTLTSIAAVPLTYYRSWALGRIGDSGDVVGQYAIILIFIGILSTFVLFGGSSVVTNFLPKILRREDKSAFLLTYALISVACVMFFVLLINIFPSVLAAA